MSELCAYELQRLENIARNQKVLEALGLVRSDALLHDELRNKEKPKAKRQKTSGPEEERAAVRRSMRLAGLSADGEAENGGENGAPSTSGGVGHRAPDGDHEDAQAEYELWAARWSGKQRGATVVGTASYAHTLMRVMTMHDSGLANRIKAIERACGQHAVAKMKLFATILALEGYVELAEEASSAYDRLREKLGEPAAVEDEDEAE